MNRMSTWLTSVDPRLPGNQKILYEKTIRVTPGVTRPRPVPAPRHTRTGDGSGPVGPGGFLSVRRRRVPRAESELMRAAPTLATRSEPGAVPGAALDAASREDSQLVNEPEFLRNSRHDGASGGSSSGRVALEFFLRGCPSSRPPHTTPESTTCPEAIPVVAPPGLPAAKQAQQVAASLCPTVRSRRTSWSSVPMLHG